MWKTMKFCKETVADWFCLAIGDNKSTPLGRNTIEGRFWFLNNLNKTMD